jgi:hypothetical protein
VPVRFTVSPPRDTTFQGMLALSPDGRRLAFVATTALRHWSAGWHRLPDQRSY